MTYDHLGWTPASFLVALAPLEWFGSGLEPETASGAGL